MKKQYLYKPILILLFLLSLRTGCLATHVYGLDFYYWNVIGNAYKVTLVIYGDCSGASFPYLPSSQPEIEVYDGTTLTQTQYLILQNPTTGVEVTPVCPSESANTSCVSKTGKIPGIKQFVYAKNIILSGPSANWSFIFTGELGSNAPSLGRSQSITNIVNPGGSSWVQLKARLNNLNTINSSPLYTVIPTPFFCVNKQARYNPGATDADNDSLSYNLVSGLEKNMTGGYVTYVNPYSAKYPISYAPGSFNFDNTNGQFNFIPDALQRSLVVEEITEYRNGTVVGSSMREFTFVVLPENNDPPRASGFSHLSGCSVADSVSIAICKPAGLVTFSIDPVDPDGDNINISTTGLPANASFKVDYQNTSSPMGTFTWDVTNVPEGLYKFFVTLTDDGCPLSARQTQIYTINVLEGLKAPTVTSNSPVCQFGTLQLKAASPNKNVQYAWQGPVPITSNLPDLSFANVTPAYAGTYTVRSYAGFCTSPPASVKVTILDAGPKPDATSNSPVCQGQTLHLSSTDIPGAVYSWSGPAGFSCSARDTTITNITFANAGRYIITATSGCFNRDTVDVLVDSLPVMPVITSNSPVCDGYELKLTAKSSSSAGFKWRGPNNFTSTDQNPVRIVSFADSGFYYLQAVSPKGCTTEEVSTRVDIKFTPPPPSASAKTPLKEWETLYLYGRNIYPGTTFNWHGPDSFYSEELNPLIPEFSSDGNGMYILSTTYEGCTSSDMIEVNVPSSGENWFVLYPNPNDGHFTVEGKLRYKNQQLPIAVYNELGIIVYRDQVTALKKKFKTDITLGPTLANAAYFFTISPNGTDYVIPFILLR